MVKLISNKYNMFYLRGAAAVVFGLTILLWPELTSKMMALSFAVFVIAWSILSLVAGYSSQAEHEYAIKFEGVLGLAVAFFALVGPGTGLGELISSSMPSIMLLYFIASWALVVGICQMLEGVRLWKETKKEWLLIACGLLSLICLLMLLFQSGKGALEALWIVGFYSILYGALHALMTFRVHKLS